MLENETNEISIADDENVVIESLGLDGDDVVDTNSTQILNSDSPRLNLLSYTEVSSIFTPFNPDGDDFFINLEPEIPQEGSRIAFKIDNCQITQNKPTKYGIKTSIWVRMNGYYNDGKTVVIAETFYLNPGEPINGRFKAFCQDLFNAFGLKSANLKDLVGREGTAIISYTMGSDGITKWPHLSQFKPLP